jgi:hypothetical protein
MKVICIDDRERAGDYPGSPNVMEGSVYTTTCSCKGYGRDGSIVLSYKLEEFDQKYCWDCDRFIPLSDISETDMQRNYSDKKRLRPVSVLQPSRGFAGSGNQQ